MSTGDELQRFVRDALGRGLPRAQVEDALVRAGWEPAQVTEALAGFADVAFPIPVPRPKTHRTAREAFLYLLLFSTLYTSAYSLGTLVFQFINRAFPDPALATDHARQAARWAVSALIVAFPVFFYLFRMTGRAIRSDPNARGSRVRRDLTYLTLFVAAVLLVGDFVALIYNFLGGELTVRFLLKVVTLGAIAGAIFTYYLLDVRSAEEESPGRPPSYERIFSGVSVGAVIVTGIGGLLLAGSPGRERLRQLDRRRVEDLQRIVSAVGVYRTRERALPESLEKLSGAGGLRADARDPATAQPYEYRVRGDSAYELCARFDLSSAEERPAPETFWSHGAGRQCFQVDAPADHRSLPR